MSDVRDMTSQMAKELAQGIKDNVEDIAAAFKKMAVINPDRERRQQITLPAAEWKTAEEPEIVTIRTSDQQRNESFMTACWRCLRRSGRNQGRSWKTSFPYLATPRKERRRNFIMRVTINRIELLSAAKRAALSRPAVLLSRR